MRCVQLRAGGPTITRIRGVLLVITVIALTGAGFGCTAARPARSVTSPTATQLVSSLTPEEIAADPAIAYGVSPDNPSAPRVDALDRTPEDAVMVLIDTLAKRNWAKAYSLYATPTPNAEMAAKGWSEADERYAEFTVRETRVADSGRAWVRVTYKITTDSSGASSPLVTLEDPGEWWSLHMVDGLWKVGWRPRR